MSKNRIIKPFIILLFGLCLIGVVYFTYKIIKWRIDTLENQQIKEKTDQKIQILSPQKEGEEPKYIIDFQSLKEINEDTVAYIYVNDTSISYVVVKGNDNSYYLSQNFEKK